MKDMQSAKLEIITQMLEALQKQVGHMAVDVETIRKAIQQERKSPTQPPVPPQPR
jgi:hypothetical protein